MISLLYQMYMIIIFQMIISILIFFFIPLHEKLSGDTPIVVVKCLSGVTENNSQHFVGGKNMLEATYIHTYLY